MKLPGRDTQEFPPPELFDQVGGVPHPPILFTRQLLLDEPLAPPGFSVTHLAAETKIACGFGPTLYQPPIDPVTWPLWAAPLALLAVGWLLARTAFRRESKP